MVCEFGLTTNIALMGLTLNMQCRNSNLFDGNLFSLTSFFILFNFILDWSFGGPALPQNWETSLSK